MTGNVQGLAEQKPHALFFCQEEKRRFPKLWGLSIPRMNRLREKEDSLVECCCPQVDG